MGFAVSIVSISIAFFAGFLIASIKRRWPRWLITGLWLMVPPLAGFGLYLWMCATIPPSSGDRYARGFLTAIILGAWFWWVVLTLAGFALRWVLNWRQRRAQEW